MVLQGQDSNCMLLDIGEGTVGQLLRSPLEFGPHLERIRAVWISHPHADHHLGILRLLHERKASNPVVLLAPRPLFALLREYAEIDSSIKGAYIEIDCADLRWNNPRANEPLHKALGITQCQSIQVTHCAHAYGVILDGTCFGRLVYSGDCRPSERLAQAAQGADLLIHEATFEDGMEAEAALKRHSTISEALSVARQMKAKQVILTHFSQRYPKIPPIPANTEPDEPSFQLAFAFDYMLVTPSTLATASLLTPALRLLFPEDASKELEGAEEMEENVSKKLLCEPGLFAKADLL